MGPALLLSKTAAAKEKEKKQDWNRFCSPLTLPMVIIMIIIVEFKRQQNVYIIIEDCKHVSKKIPYWSWHTAIWPYDFLSNILTHFWILAGIFYLAWFKSFSSERTTRVRKIWRKVITISYFSELEKERPLWKWHLEEVWPWKKGWEGGGPKMEFLLLVNLNKATTSNWSTRPGQIGGHYFHIFCSSVSQSHIFKLSLKFIMCKQCPLLALLNGFPSGSLMIIYYRFDQIKQHWFRNPCSLLTLCISMLISFG